MSLYYLLSGEHQTRSRRFEPEIPAMSILRFGIVGFALATTLIVPSQPAADPAFTINRKITLASVNKGGRIDLRYDLSRYPAKTLVVECIRYQGPKGSSKVKEWRFTGPSGVAKLDFRDLPVSQYLFTSYLLDSQEQKLPLAFRPVQLEYGGWSGRLRVHESTMSRPASDNVPWADVSSQVTGKEEYEFKVEPSALVVAPGRQGVLKATINNALAAEPLRWTLEGPGQLVVAENFLAYYQAEKTDEEQRATVRVYSETNPRYRYQVQVLVTTESVKTTSE